MSRGPSTDPSQTPHHGTVNLVRYPKHLLSSSPGKTPVKPTVTLHTDTLTKLRCWQTPNLKKYLDSLLGRKVQTENSEGLIKMQM